MIQYKASFRTKCGCVTERERTAERIPGSISLPRASVSRRGEFIDFSPTQPYSEFILTSTTGPSYEPIAHYEETDGTTDRSGILPCKTCGSFPQWEKECLHQWSEGVCLRPKRVLVCLRCMHSEEESLILKEKELWNKKQEE